jgi:energy-converting hydrogenase Eha subunit E
MNAKRHKRERTLRKLKMRQNRQRLWLIAEHPLMASGAVALLLAGIAFELSQAVKLALTLFIAAECVSVIVLLRAGYLKHNRKTAIAFLLVLAIIQFVILRALLPVPASSNDSTPELTGRVENIQRRLIGPGHGTPFPMVDLIYEVTGNRAVVGLIKNHVILTTARNYSKEELESLLVPLRDLKYTTEHDQMEKEPNSGFSFTSIPQVNDEAAKTLTANYPLIVSGKMAIYSLAVFRYRYKGMPDGMVRVTENCQWFSGDPETHAWVNCWNRKYDVKQAY